MQERCVAGDRLRTVISLIMWCRSRLISVIGGLPFWVGVKHRKPGRPNAPELSATAERTSRVSGLVKSLSESPSYGLGITPHVDDQATPLNKWPRSRLRRNRRRAAGVV